MFMNIGKKWLPAVRIKPIKRLLQMPRLTQPVDTTPVALNPKEQTGKFRARLQPLSHFLMATSHLSSLLVICCGQRRWISYVHERAATCMISPSSNKSSPTQKYTHQNVHSARQSSTNPESQTVPGGGNCPLADMKSEQERVQGKKVRKGLQ